jgi:hypothetical protein
MPLADLGDREAKRTAIVAAAGYGGTNVFVSEQPPGMGPEGWHAFGGFSGRDLDVFVASWLSDAAAEATAFHEIAHVELDHDSDPAYEEALAADGVAGTEHYRARWEIDADGLAAALVESVADRLTDPAASLAYLAEDVDRFR